MHLSVTVGESSKPRYIKICLHIASRNSATSLALCRSSRPKVFCKKEVLKMFAKLTGKHLCQGLFFNTVAGLGKTKLTNFSPFLTSMLSGTSLVL